MNPRVKTALTCVIGFVSAFAIVLIGARLIGVDGESESSETDAFSVPEALNQPSDEKVVVRGFLFFEEDFGALLCSARSADEPPLCEGSVFQLENIDPNRFDLVRPENPDGVYDAYSRDEVVLLGLKLGAVLEVEDVLR